VDAFEPEGQFSRQPTVVAFPLAAREHAADFVEGFSTFEGAGMGRGADHLGSGARCLWDRLVEIYTLPGSRTLALEVF
jgi:hypothetical protein